MKEIKTHYLAPKVSVVGFVVEGGFTISNPEPIETPSSQASAYDVWDGSYDGNSNENYNDWR